MDVNVLAVLSYTTPSSNKAVNREGYAACSDTVVCVNGTRYPAVSWDASTDCGTGPASRAYMTFEENEVTKTAFGTPQTASFYQNQETITYLLDDYSEYGNNLFAIDPVTAQLYFNGSGAYDKHTGTWSGRNFDYEDEAGVPWFKIRILARAAANAEFGTAETTINCTVRATVADANDPPLIFNLHVSVREAAA